MKRLKLPAALLALLILALAYLFFWPVPIDPAAWTPPAPPPLAGAYEPNTRLSSVERLGAGAGFAPEAVALDAGGRIYAGVADGRILRLRPDGTGPEVFARTGGRPLGLKFDRAGSLLVADADRGLLSVAPDGSVSVLSTAAEGVAFRCTNDLDVAADGTVYFTDASDKFPLEVYRHDIIEHRPRGRLLAYDPASRSTRLVLGGLHFANGVAVSPEQSFLLVAETGKYRVLRVWLAGERRGRSETFIDNLPGFPDNITSNGRGRFWLALVSPRNRLLDALLPHPFLRKAVLRLPARLQPAPVRYGFVLALDSEGRAVESLQDPSGRAYAPVASALEHGGKLYLGSIGEDAVGRLPLPTGGD